MIRRTDVSFVITTAVILPAVAACWWFVAAALRTPQLPDEPSAADPATVIEQFHQILVGSNPSRQRSLAYIDEQWQSSFTPMVVETIFMIREHAFAGSLVQLLVSRTGQSFGLDLDKWYDWIWDQDYEPHPLYADFKANLYGLIDPRFRAYFSSARPATIRLDEVRWGGIAQDGIPPLRRPLMLAAADATYLADDNIVFGIEVNGDARAYPKRIMGWHEMFVDEVGGVPVAGVFCALCGSMILYKTEDHGVNHELGTSAFLYRSNKLMYDQATQSLWSTLRGRPVIGPLAATGIALERLSVVTTTWGEWRSRHPDSRVLSLRTGHQRDYSEGAAYREYFATDELMFIVPETDDRLKNKAEVLGLVFAEYPDDTLAITTAFLRANPVYHDAVGQIRLVMLTDRSGASRVYEAHGVRFKAWDQGWTAVDAEGASWIVSEDALTGRDGRRLARLPAHRAFWFGWYAAYPRTRLVK